MFSQISKYQKNGKKKLNYQNDVIRILAKDNNFLYYVGRGGPTQSVMSETASTKMYTTDSFNNTIKNKGLKTSYSQIFPKISNRYLSEEKINLKKEIINKNENKTLEEEDVSVNENTISNSKLPNSKLKSNKKDVMTDKDIANLLEEFKIAYPIKSKKEEQHEESPESKKKENLDNQKNNLIF